MTHTSEPALPHDFGTAMDTSRRFSEGDEVEEEAGPIEDLTGLYVETSWQQQPIQPSVCTPSQASKETNRNSAPATLIDDLIHLPCSKRHFGFSSPESRTSSRFPSQKHKPVVFHQYTPNRTPPSKTSSPAGLKVLQAMNADPITTIDKVELDL